MIYTLIIPNKINKKLDRSGIKTKSRIISKLIFLKTNPRHHAERIKDTEFWKIRIGKFRVIYSIEDNKLLILIINIGHRKNIYKKY